MYGNRFYVSTVGDPFYILGVDKNAEFSEIKKQFYKLANQYHPDKDNSPVAFIFKIGKHKKIPFSERSF